MKTDRLYWELSRDAEGNHYANLIGFPLLHTNGRDEDHLQEMIIDVTETCLPELKEAFPNMETKDFFLIPQKHKETQPT